MIVDPDFPDHWKTRMLVDLLEGDEAAPVYLLRLWAHCQIRRASSFSKLPPSALKAICRYGGCPNELESALVASGYVLREGTDLVVCNWERYNAALIANWNNGKKGGRPKKTSEDLRETHGFPMANPASTDREPIREDRIRSEREDCERARTAARRPTLIEAKSAASSIGVSDELADEWWHAREASAWVKGAGGGGTTPVGTNWRADLKTYAGRMSCSRQGRSELNHQPLEWEK